MSAGVGLYGCATEPAIAVSAHSGEEGRPVGILRLGTLAGPFDFVITEKAAGVIIEAMIAAQKLIC
jgi:hypothetical protein